MHINMHINIRRVAMVVLYELRYFRLQAKCIKKTLVTCMLRYTPDTDCLNKIS